MRRRSGLIQHFQVDDLPGGVPAVLCDDGTDTVVLVSARFVRAAIARGEMTAPRDAINALLSSWNERSSSAVQAAAG